MINLVAFRQLPWRIAPITVIINLFNGSVGLSLAYSYWVLKISPMATLWLIIGATYIFAAFRQIYCLLAHRLKRRR